MKKMMMMAVMGLVGTAGAASFTAPVVFTAKVTNVCRVVGNIKDIKAPAAIDYTAAKTKELSTTASLPSTMSLECTKNTPLTIKATTAGGAPTSVAYNLPTPDAAMSLTLGTNKLDGTYSLTVNKVQSPDQMTGDKYTGSVTYKATAGQWGAPEGTYTGILNITVSYQ